MVRLRLSDYLTRTVPTSVVSGKDTHNMTINHVFPNHLLHFPYEDLSQHRYFIFLLCTCLDKDVAQDSDPSTPFYFYFPSFYAYCLFQGQVSNLLVPLSAYLSYLVFK